MANINLLPWRQARRKRQQRDFAVLTSGALVITALLMVMVHANIGQRIEYQQQRNQFLTSEIAVLDQKIKEIQELEKQKKSLIARMGVIQKLQTSRPEAVHLFDELARTIPEAVQLMDLTQTDRTLTLNGIAQSNARVSVYMRNLELSPWLQEPSLLVIESRPDGKEKKDRQMSRFSLKVTQSDDSPKDAAKSRP
jgi:type IV pilus assembly protein PilN